MWIMCSPRAVWSMHQRMYACVHECVCMSMTIRMHAFVCAFTPPPFFVAKMHICIPFYLYLSVWLCKSVSHYDCTLACEHAQEDIHPDVSILIPANSKAMKSTHKSWMLKKKKHKNNNSKTWKAEEKITFCVVKKEKKTEKILHFLQFSRRLLPVYIRILTTIQSEIYGMYAQLATTISIYPITCSFFSPTISKDIKSVFMGNITHTTWLCTD